LQRYIELEDKVCIAVSEKIKTLADDRTYDQLLTTISRSDTRAQVSGIQFAMRAHRSDSGMLLCDVPLKSCDRTKLFEHYLAIDVINVHL